MALVEAEFTPNRAKGLPDSFLLQELRDLAEELGRPPSENDIRNVCAFDPETYRRRFGSVADARETAGLLREPDYDEINKTDREVLIRALYQLANDLGRPPTATEIDEECEFSTSTYIRRFGSVKDARKSAGLAEEANKPNPRRIDEAVLLNELRRLAAELGRPPNSTDVQDLSRYSRTAFENHFESWKQATELAGLKYIGKSGPNNPNWKGGIAGEYYYGKTWGPQREKALERDNFRCQDCGITEENHLEIYDQGLHVHHISPVSEFDEKQKAHDLPNLVTLCQKHHSKWEGRNVRPWLPGRI